MEGPQTNQRAELTAFLYVLENEPGEIEVRTDSKYVQLGVEIWRHLFRKKAWYQSVEKVKEIDHADLWQKIDNLLQSRKTWEVEITWVKGHALPRHINMGLTTEENIWWNNWADELAGAASALG